jgi:putative transposase
MTRQNYYKQRSKREASEVDADLVVCLVREVRRRHPRMGYKKLYHLLGPRLKSLGVVVGRDRFGDVLRARGMLVPQLPRVPRTTDSRHSLPILRNLISDLEPTGPNQIWVSDLTYIRLEGDGKYAYLSLIMDLHSRKIVGYHCCDNLEAAGCVAALDRALIDLPADRYPIHHSDRGCQYCCHQYVDRLRSRDLPISMTEKNHCYENAFAERLNGILKQEYGLRLTFSDLKEARKMVAQAVWLYNSQRPHLSLSYRTPAEVHEPAA